MVVAVKLAKAEYRVLEPIRLLVNVKNAGAEPVSSQRSLCIYSTLKINAYQYGKLLPQTRFISTCGHRMTVGNSAIPGGGILKPGDEFRSHITANLARDMTDPGEYSVFVEMFLGREIEVGGKMVPLVARSEELRLKIIDLPLIAKPDGLDEGTWQ